MREGDFVILPYSTRNPIEYSIPMIFYQDGGLVDIPSENSSSRSGVLAKLMNIWSTDWIHYSLYHDGSYLWLLPFIHDSYPFFRCVVFFCLFTFPWSPHIGSSPNSYIPCHAKMSDGKREGVHPSRFLLRVVSNLFLYVHKISFLTTSSEPDFSAYSVRNGLIITPNSALGHHIGNAKLPEPLSISNSYWQSSCLSRRAMKWYTPSVVAPPPAISCNDRTFMEWQARLRDAPFESLVLYGLPHHLRDSEASSYLYHNVVPVIAPTGLINTSPIDQIPMSNMLVPEAKRLIYDSAKLSRLDSLLQELKAGDHRVLIYSQMTKMLDLMEEYLIYRQYKYLRLDGSSKLEDRRDMVIDWQTR